MLREMYSDTLDMDISFDVPISRLALLSRKTFAVPVHRLDAKGLIMNTITIKKKKKKKI